MACTETVFSSVDVAYCNLLEERNRKARGIAGPFRVDGGGSVAQAFYP